jgi:hypothetical protein
MSPAINVTPSQFERFEKFAKPFVDTHETTFERILSLAENVGTSTSPAQPDSILNYGVTNLPDLKHTTMSSVQIGAKKVQTKYWNSAVIEVLKEVKKVGSLLLVAQLFPVNLVEGKKTDQGYKWYPELGASVQGLAATEAAKTMLQAAEFNKIPLEIEFFWQAKPEALRPGERGKLVASPQAH